MSTEPARVYRKTLNAEVPARPAPNPNDQEHRDQDPFEEDIEEDQIERRKHANHQGFKNQKRNYVLAYPVFDAEPTGADAKHCEQG